MIPTARILLKIVILFTLATNGQALQQQPQPNPPPPPPQPNQPRTQPAAPTQAPASATPAPVSVTMDDMRSSSATTTTTTTTTTTLAPTTSGSNAQPFFATSQTTPTPAQAIPTSSAPGAASANVPTAVLGTSRNSASGPVAQQSAPINAVPPTQSPLQQPAPSNLRESSALASQNLTTVGPASAAIQTTNSIQFLKPKSKFKCLQASDCHNEGVCINGTCFCSPGFTGESCAINIDECRQIEQPCFNNGTCIDEVNSFRCDCVPGFRGDRCQEVIDMCANFPCLNNANCTNLRTDFNCECEPGWEGKYCEKNIDECLTKPCQNNGTCFDLINDYRCECQPNSGWIGKNCDVDFDDCSSKPCSFGAKECIDLIGDFKCICHDGWMGKKCEQDIDECQPMNPCENNGTCIEKSLNVLQHLHHHQQGFNSNSTNDLSNSHDLINNATTATATSIPAYNNQYLNLSMFAGYTCDCKEEFFGDRCEERKKCYTKSVFELCNHQQAECVNIGSSYECLINASFDGSGQSYATYKVIGEFKMREIYVKYRSLVGGIIMSFETSNQLENPVADLQLNKSGLYLSGAPIKRDENIKFDELLDGTEREIRLGLDSPTEIKSITLTRQFYINSTNDYFSSSLPFKGCLMQVRLNNQLLPLVDYYNNFNSSSNSFEFIDNHLEVGQCRTCFEKDCLNLGRCESQEGYDHCVCPETFSGNYCEIDVNECEKNFALCLNGGSCENLHGGHRCNCKEGYRGDKCQEISDYCKAKQPCVTGTCKNINTPQGVYQCECPTSHFGKRCERKRDCLNECHNHHGRCINNVTCACLPGRREERIMCEYVASCEQIEGELCLNGGQCKNLGTGGYHCLCQENYHGPICQYLIEKPQFDVILLIVITCVGFLMAACAVVLLVIFRSVRKARATCGTYSPSTQEKFGNSASDLLKPPQPERLI